MTPYAAFPLLMTWLVGCNGPVKIDDVIATVSADIATVVTVSWTTDVPSSGYVVYGRSGLSNESTRSDNGKKHSVTLIGLDPDTTYTFQIVVPDPQAGDSTSKEEDFTTDPLPFPRSGRKGTRRMAIAWRCRSSLETTNPFLPFSMRMGITSGTF